MHLNIGQNLAHVCPFKESTLLEVKCKYGHVFDEPIRVDQVDGKKGVAYIRCPDCGVSVGVYVLPEEFICESN